MRNILVVSTYDSDGAGIFSYQLISAFSELGYSSKLLCLKSSHKSATSIGIFDHKSLRFFFYKVLSKFRKYFFSAQQEYAFNDFTSVDKVVIGHKRLMQLQYDLLVVVYTSGMFRASDLGQLISHNPCAPTIFYGVDMGSFTGGCHYANDCKGYTKSCSNCPAVHPRAKKMVEKNHLQKFKFVKSLKKIAVISSSQQHHEQLCRSSVFRDTHINKILFYIDKNAFGTQEGLRWVLKEKYRVNGRTLLVRSSREKRKGSYLFVHAIKSLSLKEPELLRNLEILTIGDDFIEKSLIGIKAISHFGYVSEREKLSEIYSISDVFVSPSLADGGPMMVAESLMSYTPVIATKVGLTADLIIPGVNGFILEDSSSQDLTDAILTYCKIDDERIKLLRVEARNTAMRLLNKKQYVQNISALIDSLG